jgi:hypothetical protein
MLLFGASRVPVPNPHARAQPLQSEAVNAKKATETAILGVLRMRLAPIDSVVGLIRLSKARLPLSITSGMTKPKKMAPYGQDRRLTAAL